MAFIYNENEPNTFQGGIDFSKINANKPYRKHLENYYYLRFLANHEESTTNEKTQARHEMEIAERKMAFWERQQNFSREQKEADISELNQQWEIS